MYINIILKIVEVAEVEPIPIKYFDTYFYTYMYIKSTFYSNFYTYTYFYK